MSKDERREDTAQRQRRKIKNDILLIAVVILIVSVAGIGWFLYRSEGDTVTVTVDGRLWGEYPLGRDTVVEIGSEGRFNVLVIENGCAYVRSASCPDGICSAHRPIKHDGESIICLPNKVIITVRTAANEHPDVIA